MSTWTPNPSDTTPGREQHRTPHDGLADVPAYAPSGTSEAPTPEPRHVGPAAGAALRASDADRDQVAALLGAAYAEGRLTHEEHDERLGQVLAARTFDDLIPLTADLVPLAPPTATVSSPAPQFLVGNGGTTEPDRMVAVFGGVERKGRWRVRARSQVVAVFGGADLDLREADFDAPVVELDVSACFGGVDVKVPAGLTVRDETTHVFGGVDLKHLGEPVEGAPTLVLKGTVLFGGITVKGPRPALRELLGGARPGPAALDARAGQTHEDRRSRQRRRGRGCGH